MTLKKKFVLQLRQRRLIRVALAFEEMLWLILFGFRCLKKFQTIKIHVVQMPLRHLRIYELDIQISNVKEK